MENTELTALVSEMRAEFQIPPYYEDSQLANLAREGECTVGSLNPGCNITTDLTYRMLLKNYMYYAYHHRVSEFMDNYSSMIFNVADGNGGGSGWQCLNIQMVCWNFSG